MFVPPVPKKLPVKVLPVSPYHTCKMVIPDFLTGDVQMGASDKGFHIDVGDTRINWFATRLEVWNTACSRCKGKHITTEALGYVNSVEFWLVK